MNAANVTNLAMTAHETAVKIVKQTLSKPARAVGLHSYHSDIYNMRI